MRKDRKNIGSAIQNKTTHKTLLSSMLTVVLNICDQLNDFRLRFAGVYDLHTDQEMCNIERDLYNDDIPTVRNDKANLKADMTNIAKDFNKGYHAKKSELVAK